MPILFGAFVGFLFSVVPDVFGSWTAWPFAGLGALTATILQRGVRREVTRQLETARTEWLDLARRQWAAELAERDAARVSEEAGQRGGAASEPVDLAPVATGEGAPPAAPAPASSEPRTVEPGAMQKGLMAARDWLLGGNTIVRVGLVILFIGLSFLARYAAMAGLLPPELRLAAIGAVGIGLLAIGFRQRAIKPAFALALQGAGVGVLYLTIFAAYRLYELLPAPMAFALMLIVCALGSVLALQQNAQSLSLASFAGGFATPILLASGQGNHVGLFSYYLLLNLAILVIATKRWWRWLTILGFIATFGVATLWGVLRYEAGHYASTQPFLIGFVLIYIAAAWLAARSSPPSLTRPVDSMVVFGTPLVAFGLQAGLVQGLELGQDLGPALGQSMGESMGQGMALAFSALGFGALYLVTAALLWRGGERYRLLFECFLALGVGFATLAVPLGLDARWTSGIWALEGAGAFWVGLRQSRWMPRFFGLLLQGMAVLSFLAGGQGPTTTASDPHFLDALLLALPALIIAWWLRGRKSGRPEELVAGPALLAPSRWARLYLGFEQRLADPAYLYGFAAWCLAWIIGVKQAGLAPGLLPLVCLWLVLFSMAGSQELARRRQWPVAARPGMASLPVMAIALVWQFSVEPRVGLWVHWPGWLIALACHFWMLRWRDQQNLSRRSSRAIHVGGAWLLTLLLGDTLARWIGQADLWGTAWAAVAGLATLVAVLLLLTAWAGQGARSEARAALGWPLRDQALAYLWTAALPLAALLYAGALLVAGGSSGLTAPLPYIPLLNPTDLTLALGLATLLLWRRRLMTVEPAPAGSRPLCARPGLIAVAGLAFFALNTVWLRVAHHFFGVDWDASGLFESFVVQTGYAILWSVTALACMLFAHRRGQRLLWQIGAGLLAVVVVKLLLIDLSNRGGAERIVAFIVVGVMMLVVGYFAPMPPKVAAVVPDKEVG